ncbi:DUF222 domain-containing protein [Flexivirga oryzae]|uniref:Arc/MetJ family transcription regulator n=1 Tax=Flexivirga oryzae TaxID=1794944 RepID=A0A839N9E1_9MICO|nr:DUF222 domain-containing protein [Flexivirga oryzae]MBB2892266.1 Arc/MetJ family transcription regulator [Flexivirga oryzae]
MNEIFIDEIGSCAAVTADAVRSFQDRLDGPLSTEDLLAEVRACEELKNALSARQARATVALHERQRERDTARGIRAADTARLVGSQVALARRIAPSQGSRLLGVARAVTQEMPHTFEALRAGVISEHDATTLVAETACLTKQDREQVDAAVRPELGRVGHRRLRAAAQAAAYAADPAAITARRSKAESQRRVSLRPAPDCMAWLTALLPVKDGVACYAALKAEADRAATPEHPRGQVMADTLVERVTGRAPADGVEVHVNLIMGLDSLTGDTPAEVPGYGPVPADLVREWFADPQKATQVRRLFAYPGTGDLVGWTPPPAATPGSSPISSHCGTAPAGRHGAMRRSGTPTTYSPTHTAVPRPNATAKGCANAATTSRNTPTTSSAATPAKHTSSPAASPPPAHHHPHPAYRHRSPHPSGAL